MHVLRPAHGISEIEARGAQAVPALCGECRLIEDKASGTQLIQELVAGGLHAVIAPAAHRFRSQPQAMSPL